MKRGASQKEGKSYMKNLCLIIVSLSALALLTSGCGGVVASPLSGCLYTNVNAPIDSEEGVADSKTGEACAVSILGLVAFGDASIDAAKKAGGISAVSTVDYHSTGCLTFLYGRFCTVVTGK